jgi:hypothetical protein
MAKRAALAGLVAFALVAAVLWIPWLVEKRGVIDSTPVPRPIFGVTPVALAPASEACLNQVTLGPGSQVGELGVETGGRPGPELVVTASSEVGSYRHRVTIPAGYDDDPSLRFQLVPPRETLIGKVCIRNAGRRPVTLAGTNEFRTMGRPVLSVDGQMREDVDVRLAFLQRAPHSYGDRVGSIFRHAAAFTPGFLPRALLFALALLALVAIPLGAMAALAAAGRDDERPDEPVR